MKPRVAALIEEPIVHPGRSGSEAEQRATADVLIHEEDSQFKYVHVGCLCSFSHPGTSQLVVQVFCVSVLLTCVQAPTRHEAVAAGFILTLSQ